MRDKVLRYIRERDLIRAGDRLLVAVSGGADSVALLRVLLQLRMELGVVLAVAHLNHGLRGDAALADEHFVAELAQHHQLGFFHERVNVAAFAAANRLSLEAAGRRLRYDFLRKTAEEHRFNQVATAHTQDDQVETVLLKFLRGAGTRGRAGIHPVMVLSQHPGVRFVRPLLETSRSEVEAYLAVLAQPWREDESNLDRRFRRNRVRHDLLPLLERDYNPNLRQVLRETAEVDRAEEEYWSCATREMLERLRLDDRRLRFGGFTALPEAMQRRVLKRFLEEAGIAPDFRHIEQVRSTALGKIDRCELPGGWTAVRQDECLLLQATAQGTDEASGYQYALSAPGEVRIPELHAALRVIPIPEEFATTADPGTLLRADLLTEGLCVRSWQPGDRYQPAYSGSEQKLKRLFSERHIPAEARRLWPVVVKGDAIIWVRDLPVADSFCWRPGDGEACRIEVS